MNETSTRPDDHDTESHLGRIVAISGALGGVALGLVAAGIYTYANWHGIPLPPMHLDPIHNQEAGFVSDQVAKVGDALFGRM